MSAQSFEFHGKATEFFKIWIVNIMLSILTLGIYSAWAKVRTRKYFYNNTLLNNSSFDYLAEPIKILKGRLFVLALFLLYSFSSLLSPYAQGIVMIILIPLLPWIIIKALRFNMYNTAYRNLRFHFTAQYLQAAWVFLALPVLVAFSLGLAYPFFVKAQKKFIIEHTSYGRSDFLMDAETGQFYSIFIKLVGLIILIMVLLAILPRLLGFTSELDKLATIPPQLMLTTIPLMFALYLFAFAYWTTQSTNLVLNHSSIQGNQLQSNLSTDKVFWLYLGNTAAIIFSFGLLIPWAMIRMARYRVYCLSLIVNTDLDSFIAAETEQAAAVGEEMGDFLDLDLGL